MKEKDLLSLILSPFELVAAPMDDGHMSLCGRRAVRCTKRCVDLSQARVWRRMSHDMTVAAPLFSTIQACRVV